MNNNQTKVVRLRRGFVAFVGLALMWMIALPLTERVAHTEPTAGVLPDKVATLWKPYVEWSLENSTYAGNPYDLVAVVTFTHATSGESRRTEMFYDGNNVWKFRFAGTRTGVWNFVTSSADSDLDGWSGKVTVNPNPGVRGFVTHFGSKWGYSGTNEVFVPQFVMIGGPHVYYNSSGKIDAEIQTFLVEHGFNGFHTPVYCRWFDINQPVCSNISGSSPNPDRRTFEVLETLITKAQAQGGLVHIWLWGDNQDKRNPNYLPGGINGPVDRRLQRYIAARLGPLPGWTMGYGSDLYEWVTGAQLSEWHDYMQAHLGWPHYLGARSYKNKLTQLSSVMDYSSYEQHEPDYAKYVETIETCPIKPSFSEDRFRIRGGRHDKDYTMENTRRGLWHSTMAGGVANIWGNLVGALGANSGSTTSAPYPKPEWIKTYSLFFAARFLPDMSRCNGLTDGVCLKRATNSHFVFYKENTTSVRINLSGMAGVQPAVAIDTKLPYNEIDLGVRNATDQTWSAPYQSDWAIAVGTFKGYYSNTDSTLGPAHWVGPLTDLNSFANSDKAVYLPLVINTGDLGCNYDSQDGQR